MGHTARDRRDAFEREVEVRKCALDAAADRRVALALLVPTGEASFADFAKAVGEEDVLARLVADLRDALPAIRAAAVAEEEDERQAPARAEAMAKQRRDEALWRHPANARRLFGELMGPGVPPDLFAEVAEYIPGIRAGDVEAGEPRSVVIDMDSFCSWCIAEKKLVPGSIGLGPSPWPAWLRGVETRHGKNTVHRLRTGERPGWSPWR